MQAMAPSGDGVYLYKHLIHPFTPNLLFCGNTVTFNSPLTVSVQAAWLAELLLGNIGPPSPSIMHAEISLQREAHSHYPPSPLRSKLLNLHGDQYHDVLMQDMHVEHLARYGGPFGPIANAVLPRTPAMCGNALQPVAQRKCNLLRPPRLLKVSVIGIIAVLGCNMHVRHGRCSAAK